MFLPPRHGVLLRREAEGNKEKLSFPFTPTISRANSSHNYLVLWEAVSPRRASQACVFLVMPRSLAKMGANADTGICALTIVLKLSFILHRTSNGH